MALKTISKLKKELDNIFSLFIRLRGANEFGLVQCFTCGAVKHYKKGMQNGHFQSRRFMSTRFDEENCQIQCVKCNMFEQGQQYEFGLQLDAKYGEGTADELICIAHKTVKFTRSDYDDKLSYYKSAVQNLKKQKGIE